MSHVTWSDLGRRPYREVWEIQRRLVDQLKGGAGPDRLLLVEHEPVFTLGRRTDPENLLVSADELRLHGADLAEVERAGDVTFHGPGQLVAYPIMDLRRHRKDVRWFACSLLQAIVATLATYGLVSHVRYGKHTGVWMGADGAPTAKIAAMGVRIERWIAYHGVALNVDPDLSWFDFIVPCGIRESPVTSMAGELDRRVDLQEVRPRFIEAFGESFGVTMSHGALPTPELDRPSQASEAAGVTSR